MWGEGGGEGGASKRFQPSRNLVAPAVGSFFRTYITGIMCLIGSGANNGAGAEGEEKKTL